MEYGVPQEQILKFTEPYRAIPHTKALIECFPDQLKF
jgi:hypothetical protein